MPDRKKCLNVRRQDRKCDVSKELKQTLSSFSFPLLSLPSDPHYDYDLDWSDRAERYMLIPSFFSYTLFRALEINSNSFLR